jgi:hypothetical protein
MSRLLLPLEIQPPATASKPEFTSGKDWTGSVNIKIQAQLESADAPLTEVPPMDAVRCSQGGKTWALYEIAHRIHATSHPPGAEPVAVIFVTFNNFSSLQLHEQDDPVNALCQMYCLHGTQSPHAAQRYNEQITSLLYIG